MKRIAWPLSLVVAMTLAGFAFAACGKSPKTVAPSTSATSTSTSTSIIAAPKTTTSVPSISPYVGLWPFRTAADVQSWEESYHSTGSGAWHLNSATTALDFTMDYLGFTEINEVLGTTTNASGAHVSVGFSPTSTESSTAAVVHLVRWGAGADAPWEVVGTDDTTFSLTQPAYGATASSPLGVGGTISGVDESIKVTVRQPSSSAAIGTFCCLPAGGTNTPWSATVGFSGATDPVLTITAQTGGHIQDVERFTVTGVRNAAPH